MKKYEFSRREFIKKASLATGTTVVGGIGVSRGMMRPDSTPVKEDKRRNISIVTISQMDLEADSPEEMIDQVFDIMERTTIYQPDLICLPEAFATLPRETGRENALQWKVEVTNNILNRGYKFARKHQCYVVCTGHLHENGKFFNVAYLIDRQGTNMGAFRKIHPTIDELDEGITPGPLHPPIFQTDFGKVGFQICFDILWDDGWGLLKDQGADIVIWPSAYAGGQAVNAKAWGHQYIVVSSTGKGTTKICDISGETIAKTGSWDKNFTYATVNLEKAFLHTWPAVIKFDAIRKKYGKKVKITNFHEEEWSIIESLSPDLKIDSIMEEFNLVTLHEYIKQSSMEQNRFR